jgi:hypothetical protein
MKILYSIFFLCLFSALSAQKKTILSGQYEMALEKNKTMEETEKKCMEQARLSAMGKEFGYRITEVTINNQREVNRARDEQFQSITQTSVMGEWMQDIQSPLVQWSCQGNTLSCQVQIKGEAVSISQEGKITFDITTSNDPQCKTPLSRFQNNDRLYVKMRSSAKGYLSVFYWDHAAKVMYRLLPSAQYNALNGVKIAADQSYILFHDKMDFPEHPVGLPLTLDAGTGNGLSQLDEIILVYSDQEMQKPGLQCEENLCQLSEVDFLKWKSNLYHPKNRIEVQYIPIEILR